jgi:hypothetical protein
VRKDGPRPGEGGPRAREALVNLKCNIKSYIFCESRT